MIYKTQAEQIPDKIEEELTERPDSFPQLSGKFSGLRKFRVGNYLQIQHLLPNIMKKMKSNSIF
jgi:mRNA-degrading endonuclease RelE of RelBE toxin-antitoxin system